MSRFVQSLESRMFLSATPVSKATLVADEALIVADGAGAKADLVELTATLTADTRAIQATLKQLPKTNLPLFQSLKVHETKLLSLIRRDLNAVLGPATALARRSVADGVASMLKSTAAVGARVAADIAGLGTITNGPVATLQADAQGPSIGADLQALLAANPSSTSLASDISALQNDAADAATTLTGAVLAFQADIGALATDVAAAPAATGGSTGSTIPNLVGTYSGPATTTGGNRLGQVATLKLFITSEGADGSLSGTAIYTGGSNTIPLSLTGSVSANHAFTITLFDPTGAQNGATLTGTASVNTLAGTFVSDKDNGTFRLVK
jgi:hypothetical protein